MLIIFKKTCAVDSVKLTDSLVFCASYLARAVAVSYPATFVWSAFVKCAISTFVTKLFKILVMIHIKILVGNAPVKNVGYYTSKYKYVLSLFGTMTIGAVWCIFIN